jgi:hypothetical protein
VRPGPYGRSKGGGAGQRSPSLASDDLVGEHTRVRAMEAAAAMRPLPEPVDDATRTKRIADLKRQTREAEGREIDLCWELLDAGVEFDWRPGLDPALVLGLEAA